MEKVNSWLSGYATAKAENEITEIECLETYLKEQEEQLKDEKKLLERFKTIRAVQIHVKRLDAIRNQINAKK